MKTIALIPLALVAAACATTGPREPTAEEQAALAAELEGRTAGEPVSCLRQQNLGGNRSIGEQVIIFEGHGNTLWINRPRHGCPIIDRDRILITRTTSGQLCSGDIIEVVERSVGPVGSCALGDFTPYTRRAD